MKRNNEIDVPPEMIEAGVDAVRNLELEVPTVFDVTNDELRLILPVAFGAMLRAQHEMVTKIFQDAHEPPSL